MLALLFPAALAALIALAIPLLVHLARRSEARPTDFAALEWLREKPRPKSRLRFDERPLLVLRLLLIVGLAIWLARPVLRDSADMTPVVAAVPGVDAGPPSNGVRNIWLTTGFPSYDEPQESCVTFPPAGTANDGVTRPAACPPLSTLIRQLDAELPPGVPLTLIVPEILSGLDAERPRLSRPVTWRIAPGAMPAVASPPPRLRFSLPAGPERGLRYLRAAATALGSPATSVPPPIIVHLAPGALPDTARTAIAGGATALVAQDVTLPGPAIPVWRDGDGQALATLHRVGNGRVYRFTRPLTPAAMPILLDPDFPRQLAAMLAPPPPPSRAMARDMAPTVGAVAWPVPARDLQPWLAFVLAGLFLVERWLATRRIRAISP
jgi:hypothetical protein